MAFEEAFKNLCSKYFIDFFINFESTKSKSTTFSQVQRGKRMLILDLSKL